MAHEAALMIVNQMQDKMAEIARAVVDDLEDNKISMMESMMLGFQAGQLGVYFYSLMKGADVATKKDVLYVLEHMDIVLP